MPFRTNNSGHIDFSPEYLDWLRQQADFTPEAEPLRLNRGLLDDPQEKHDCGCGCHGQPAVNRGHTAEPLKLQGALTR